MSFGAVLRKCIYVLVKKYLFIYISFNSWPMTNWHAKCDRGMKANHGNKTKKERKKEG